MENNLMILLGSFLGGLTQGVSGFGAVVVMMVIFPYFETLKDSMAISSMCAMPMNLFTVFLYRQKISFKKVLGPVMAYYVATLLFTRIAAAMNLEAFKPVFGAFLVFLSLYFMYFSKKIHVKESKWTAILCMFTAGLTMTFFGISGPVIVLYYVAVLTDKEEYVGTLGFIFLITNIFTAFVRGANGFYRWELVAPIAFGFVGVLSGFYLGSRLIRIIDGVTVKKLVYIILAVSGSITALKGIF